METSSEVRAMADALGRKEFRRVHGYREHGPSSAVSAEIKVMFAEWDRDDETALRLAEADRGALTVGQGAEANQIGWWSIRLSILAVVVSACALGVSVWAIWHA